MIDQPDVMLMLLTPTPPPLNEFPLFPHSNIKCSIYTNTPNFSPSHSHSDGTIPPPPPLPMSPPPPPPLAPSFSHNLTSIGLGYAISIALGFLVFFSTVILASYICSRSFSRRRRRTNQNPNNSTENNSIYLPRIIFVADDDDSESQNAVVGLDQAVINSYPKLVFTKRGGNWGNDAVCSICLCEYREAEMLRMLPDCRHCFHVMCVDAWLKLNASCPNCRNSPLPTPLSTPLQEVVPLSQYADGRRR